MESTPQPTIWIDGDAAPRACKDVLYRASQRSGLVAVVVANQYTEVPRSRTVRFVQVPGGPDVADDYIAEHCVEGDLVVTADIPLAARVVEVGGTVICFRGDELDASNVQSRLSVRDFMADLRDSGVETGGPKAFDKRDKQRFANAIDRWVHRAARPS